MQAPCILLTRQDSALTPCRVGKTTLVNTYLHGQPLESPEPTLGADLSSKQLTLKELHLSLQVVPCIQRRFCWQVSAHMMLGTEEQLYLWQQQYAL